MWVATRKTSEKMVDVGKSINGLFSLAISFFISVYFWLLIAQVSLWLTFFFIFYSLHPLSLEAYSLCDKPTPPGQTTFIYERTYQRGVRFHLHYHERGHTHWKIEMNNVLYLYILAWLRFILHFGNELIKTEYNSKWTFLASTVN